jgi:hypothetical protein
VSRILPVAWGRSGMQECRIRAAALCNRSADRAATRKEAPPARSPPARFATGVVDYDLATLLLRAARPNGNNQDERRSDAPPPAYLPAPGAVLSTGLASGLSAEPVSLSASGLIDTFFKDCPSGAP